MGRFFAGVVLLAVAFLALVLIVRAIGGTAKNSLAAMFTVIDLPNGKTQACWHDICPGQTTLDDAQKILNSAEMFVPPTPNWPTCWKSRGPEYWICLNAQQQNLESVEVILDRVFDYSDDNSAPLLAFRLGDAIAYWGYPVAISPPNCEASNFYFEANISLWATWVKKSANDELMALDADLSKVIKITLLAPALYKSEYWPPEIWNGFVTHVDFGCFGD